MGTMSGQPVSFECRGALGLVTLSRPDKLNALSADMIEMLHDALDRCERDERITVVLLRSDVDRAFCAGGDIKAVRRLVLDGRHDAAVGFFEREFALNLRIARSEKPVVSLVHGLCLGGGCGLAMHGRFRIVSEDARIGMPETAIGYFPDVGASAFLSRLPGAIGLYMGLTGVQIDGRQARACGLATHFAARADFKAITDVLATGVAVKAALAPFDMRTDWQDEHIASITRFFGRASSVGDIFARLGAAKDDAFATEALGLLEAASPSSLDLAFNLQHKARGRTLEAVLALELRAASERIRHPDFLEGVGARLVERRVPMWGKGEHRNALSSYNHN